MLANYIRMLAVALASVFPLTQLVEFRNVFAFESKSVSNCLHGEPGGPSFEPSDSDCTDDPSKIGDQAYTGTAESVFSLTKSEVRFLGCKNAAFSTSSRPIGSFRCIVTYPNRNRQIEPYEGAVLHELGHCFQLKEAGSMQALETKLGGSRERIELGADFLAGLVGRRLALRAGEYVKSADLTGSYRSDDPDWHGRPEDRASAFRQGYFNKRPNVPPQSSYVDFQDNRFAEITQGDHQ